MAESSSNYADQFRTAIDGLFTDTDARLVSQSMMNPGVEQIVAKPLMPLGPIDTGDRLIVQRPTQAHKLTPSPVAVPDYSVYGTAADQRQITIVPQGDSLAVRVLPAVGSEALDMRPLHSGSSRHSGAGHVADALAHTILTESTRADIVRQQTVGLPLSPDSAQAVVGWVDHLTPIVPVPPISIRPVK